MLTSAPLSRHTAQYALFRKRVASIVVSRKRALLTCIAASAAGSLVACEASADGQVVGFGSNAYGELSTGNTPLLPYAQVSAGGRVSFGLRSDGTVAKWGGGGVGVEAALFGVAQVAASCQGNFGDADIHAIALKSDQTVVCWGSNGSSQCTVPVGLRGVRQVTAGGRHSVALLAAGNVVAWGSNAEGQCRGTGSSGEQIMSVTSDGTDVTQLNGAPLGGVVKISAGARHNAAVTGAGSVVCWGRIIEGQSTVPAGLSGVTQVAAGGVHTVALRIDGSVVGWGDALYSTPPVGLNGVVQISASAFNTFALRADGTVLPFVDNDDAVPPAGLTDVVQIAAGKEHAVALKRDGSAVCWGRNFYGEISPPTTLRRVTHIAAGLNHCVALHADGTTVAWGSNVYYQSTGWDNLPSRLVDIKQVSTLNRHSLALRNDGSVHGWGDQPFGECLGTSASGAPILGAAIGDQLTQILGVTLTGVRQISAGSQYTAALKEDGSVICWGRNVAGQCTVPTGLSGVVQVVASASHTLAVRSDGTLWAWGANGNGQCRGTGPDGSSIVSTTFNGSLPVQILGVTLSGVVQAASGTFHSLALRGDGTVAAWGGNDFGQAVVPPGLASVIQVAAGSSHSVALRVDGTVVAWGDNRSGQCELPLGINRVATIAAGGDHTFVVLEAAVSSCGSSQGLGHASLRISGSAWDSVGVWAWASGLSPQVPGPETSVTVGPSMSVGANCSVRCAALDLAESATWIMPLDLANPSTWNDHAVNSAGAASVRGRVWLLASGRQELPEDLSATVVSAGSFQGLFSIIESTVPSPPGKFLTLVPSVGYLGVTSWSLALRDLPSALGSGTGNTGSVAGNAVSAETMDLNGDGFDDLALAIDNGPLQHGTVQVLLNDGLGNLGGTTSVFADAGAPSPTSIATGDVDGDGRDDLVVGLAGNNTAKLFLGGGSGSGTLTGSTVYFAEGTPISVLVIPSEAGAAGLVVVGTLGVSNRIGLYAAGSGTPSQQLVVQPQPTAIAKRGRIIATGGSSTTTVDGLVGEGGALAVLTPDASGNYSVTQTIPVPGKPRSIDVADVDRDGIADAMSSNSVPQQVGIGTPLAVLTFFKGNSSGFGDPIPIAPQGATAGADCALVDVNADGVRDIVSVHQTIVGQSAAAAILIHQATPGGPMTLGVQSAIDSTRPILCPRGDLLGPGSEGVFIVDAGTSAFKRGGGSVAIPYRPQQPRCTGDVDLSGMVDGNDLALVLNAWGGGGTSADIDGSGVVDGGDLALVLNAWGGCLN